MKLNNNLLNTSQNFNSNLVPYTEHLWSPVEDIFNFAFIYDTSTTYNNLKNIQFVDMGGINFDPNEIPSLNSFSNNFLLNSNFLADNSSFVSALASTTFSKNNPEDVYKFFPQMQEAFTDLEILFDEAKDESTLEYMRTIPDGKLYYPEPFIASPSFLHEEIWFIHILHYNYWLWFFFISLIMFYFITFIHVVRWCNLRSKPKRETRGVSRSKCADLITACVPVSWALSIIISETVDATDYYDGFGTGEVVIGIRAYQWGWEYFYPKNIDLNYNVSPSYSSFIGNSIKYNNTSSENLDANAIWKFYQKKK